MKMRPILVTAVSVFLLATAGGIMPAQAAPSSDESYLFVLDSKEITVKPGKGDHATITLGNPDVVRFTDRPYHHALNTGLKKLLASFGWDAKTEKLAGPRPNAAISIDGKRSEIVEIRKVHRQHGVVTLSVTGVQGASNLKASSGAGSVVIDNATTIPTTVYPYFQNNLRIAATLVSPTEVDISLYDTSGNWKLVGTMNISTDKLVNQAIVPIYNTEALVFAYATFTSNGVSVKFLGNFYQQAVAIIPIEANAYFSL